MHRSTLVELHLDGEQLTDISVTSVGEYCHLLRVLDISFCDLLTDATLMALRNLRQLRRLRLKRGTSFSARGLKRLFEPLPESRGRRGGKGLSGDGSNDCENSPFPDIETLMLPECSHLDNDGLGMIVEACGDTITHLNLSW